MAKISAKKKVKVADRRKRKVKKRKRNALSVFKVRVI